MDYYAGTDIIFTHDFVSVGEPFSPDAGSVKYTVYDATGATLPGLVDVPVSTVATDWQVSFVISASNNLIGVGKSFDRRTVVVSYTVGGVAQRSSTMYRIIAMAQYSVEPKDVRNFIGLQEKELLDEDIDLFAAYLYVSRDLADTVAINTALTSGTTAELRVNEMIKLRAVIDVLPSLRQRMAQEESNGVTSYKRLAIKDFDGFEAMVLGRYAGALEEILDATGIDVTLILITTDADPITGA